MATNVTVPQCSAHVSVSLYTAAGRASFELTSWPYYKKYVTSAQIIPGLAFGVLCWILALAFTIWLITLCCRNVTWRSRRTREHDVPSKRRNFWACFNILLFLVVLGVIGSGTWALVEGLKSTDSQVNDVWGAVGQAKSKLLEIKGNVDLSSANLYDLGNSVNSTYSLVYNNSTNQAILGAAGVNVPSLLSTLRDLGGTLGGGYSAASQVSSAIEDTGVKAINDLQSNYQKRTTDAWRVYRPIAVAVFFGLLILFGVIAGVLALLDRTPRLTATATLILWIWTGLVLLLGAGVFNILWRVSRDLCLYGIDYLSEKLASGDGIQTVINYYFGRTYIPPNDVSQQLFGVNLPSIISTLNDPGLNNLASLLQTPAGQSVIASAPSANQAAINLLPNRIGLLRNSLTTLNNSLLVSSLSGLVNSIKSLICCSSTTALWNLWLASVIVGAVAALLALMTTTKVITSIHRMGKNRHYSPHNPNGAIVNGQRFNSFNA